VLQLLQMVKKWLNAIALYRKPTSELWSITHRMGSQCYPPPDTGEHAPP